MSSPLRIVIVDDEPLAVRRLALLAVHIPDVDVVGSAASGEDALDCIRSCRPDAVLLDIELGGIDGIQVAAELAAPGAPKVIFVTAFDSYAARAFELSAVDYILKPVELDRLTESLSRVRRQLDSDAAADRVAELKALIERFRVESRLAAQAPARRYETEIWAPHRGDYARIKVDDIELIEAEGDYVRLHARGSSHLLRESLTGIEQRLDPDRFVRIRRSTIVRLDGVRGIRRAGYGDFRVTLASGEVQRVGRTYVRAVRDRLRPGAKSG